MFKGSCVALVTPFKNGSLDDKALRDLVEFHIAKKTSAIVPCGSTGESATLTHEEHRRVTEIVVRQARGRISVLAGAGSNSTAETIALSRHAEKTGAQAALVIVPYYNKPTQKGLVEHFTAVARSVRFPLVLYNIPSRTGVNMTPDTFAQIVSKNKNVIGIKESSGNLDQASEIAAILSGRRDSCLLSGDDSLTLPILSIGGAGVISVLANIAPADVQELCSAFFAGNLKKAQALHAKMFPLVKALFLETNPIPIKTAMGVLKLCSPELRLPLTPIGEESRERLLLALKKYGLKQ